jgi:hypothetical protein
MTLTRLNMSASYRYLSFRCVLSLAPTWEWTWCNQKQPMTHMAGIVDGWTVHGSGLDGSSTRAGIRLHIICLFQERLVFDLVKLRPKLAILAPWARGK